MDTILEKNHPGERRFDANKVENRKRTCGKRGYDGRRGGKGGKKGHSFWHRYRRCFPLFLRSQNNATLIATVCSMKRHNIWTALRARARPRPPSGYAPPLLDKYAPSQHSQYRIQLRLIVFSAGTGVKERQTPRRVLTCTRHYARPHVVDSRITATTPRQLEECV